MFLSPKKNKSVNNIIEESMFDETTLGSELKPEWNIILENLNILGLTEIQQRNKDLQKQLLENGVTYNVYDGHLALQRSWNLDPIPWVLNANEWKTVERGLIQRAEILNFILKDLYGKKELLKSGIIPHELVYCHKGFLRQCDNISFGNNYPLALYAADIARGPDGKMWMVNDRTQAPSGMGYALENRSAMIHVLPDLFNSQRIRKISDFFHTYYDSLCQLAPNQKENPRIAMLTPGEKNETYFEHAFLADYIGVNLVQGSDLLVKDSCVWIKTIHGLEQIDIIVRRVDDIFCDPLEFRPDSKLGVPGLLEAVRKGNVVIANPLGSGILENPGLIPFLGKVCKTYFNEDFILPTVATWWCGQPKELGFVLSNLDTLLVKKIDRYTGSPTIIPSLLSKQDLAELVAKIKHEPYLYVGQEKVNFSAVPSLVNNELESRFAVLRGFAIGSRSGYSIMPGGLTRSSPEKDRFIVSNQAGGISKDTWIVAEPEHPSTSLKAFIGKLNPRLNESLTSRMAENLFWTGRYSERVLGTLRLLKVALNYTMENSGGEYFTVVNERILCALTELTMTYPGFVGTESKESNIDAQTEIFDLCQNESRIGGLAFNLRNLVQSIQSVGGFLSNDARRMVENLKDNSSTLRKLKPLGYLNLSGGLDKTYNSLVSLLGFITESMPREQGWMMFQTGRKIERSHLIATLVNSTLIYKDIDQVQVQVLEAVLKSNQLISTYRFKFRSYLNLEQAIDLLLFDENNPRSIAYQLHKLTVYLDHLSGTREMSNTGFDQEIVLESLTMVKMADRSKLLETEEGIYIRKNLKEVLDRLQVNIGKCSLALTEKYFSHSASVQSLVYPN
ncbi:MAG: circularly permuted type 2 ATP-grasp protein [Opitutaceae bacterium]|nr:circularly permuted type 2 ATP-grasp protein [Cytophagales bacterium]